MDKDERLLAEYNERRKQVRNLLGDDGLHGDGVYIPFPELADYMTRSERESIGLDLPADWRYSGKRTPLRI